MNDFDLKEILKDNGFRVTNQRNVILKAIAKCPGRHLTAEEVYDLVKADFPEIGLTTVYRTIQLFLELGLVYKINFDDGFVRYELAEREKSSHHHHHLICLKCGKVNSFEDDMLDELENQVSEKLGFEVINHEVKLYGYCTKCKDEK